MSPLKSRDNSPSRSKQTGLTLVELIVAMVIGLTVVGAGLAMYVSSGFSSRGGSALSQMTEDANIALSLIRSQVAMAGFSQPKGVNASTGQMLMVSTDTPVFGCTGGATSDTRANALTAVVCANSSTSPDSIMVAYQADTNNTIAAKATPSIPTDCLGNPVGVATDVYFVARNQYFVDGGSLKCLGNGKSSTGGPLGPQPLVDNIVDMKITYGVAPATSTSPQAPAVRYLTATQISGTNGVTSDLWSHVSSVRICLIVSSASDVFDAAPSATNANTAAAAYFDCSGQSVTPTDKRLYRAFTTTVALQNRIPLPSPPSP